MADWPTIRSGDLTARINPLGAELSSLTDAHGRELMTDADPAFWTGRAPILFPIVGRLNADTLRVDGRAYPMKQHGFARWMPFAVVAAEADRATFALTDGDATRAAYPFAFRLEIGFRVEAATLHVEAAVHNPGDTDLPASLGFHPAFAWPLPFGRPREDHRILFDADEPDPIRRLGADGTVLATPVASPLDGRTLPLTDALFAHDALIWDRVRSSGVAYGAGDGPNLRIAFPDTPMLGVWSKPGARFVCIEPWHGLADPQGFTGEFRDKPGVFFVPPGEARRIAMRISLA
ncbi:aldose 1-epimerase family protein [Sphingomonas bacterium]|uniref:aldose 1-epimerase family protein n=1 Tax=Sphingomonas bacterium TaxID=1895847 RepID=UPI0015756E38|nr:aldose 1-epimerase family protein [Sphingomonas bacterium]